MVPLDNKPNTTAILSTTFRHTDNQCIKFFFSIIAESNGPSSESSSYDPDFVPGKIELVVINENLQHIVYESLISLARWNMVYQYLPPGINKIMIRGTRASRGISGFALDDISIDECSQLGMPLFKMKFIDFHTKIFDNLNSLAITESVSRISKTLQLTICICTF